MNYLKSLIKSDVWGKSWRLGLDLTWAIYMQSNAGRLLMSPLTDTKLSRK